MGEFFGGLIEFGSDLTMNEREGWSKVRMDISYNDGPIRETFWWLNPLKIPALDAEGLLERLPQKQGEHHILSFRLPSD